MCACVCVYARACAWWLRRPGGEGTGQLSDGHRCAACIRQGRLQSPDLGKHLAGVEDLLQLHELVEADIAVQAERVRAVSASALRFRDPGTGETARLGKPVARRGDGWVATELGREAKERRAGTVCNQGWMRAQQKAWATALDSPL